jgi:hypothetical protein
VLRPEQAAGIPSDSVEEQSGETIDAVSPLVSSITTSFDDPDLRVKVAVDPGSA